jgi:hypothetical protein
MRAQTQVLAVRVTPGQHDVDRVRLLAWTGIVVLPWGAIAAIVSALS